MTEHELKARIEELEADLQARDDRIKELKNERREAFELVEEMREWIEDRNAMVETWKEAFRMVQLEDGSWEWGESTRELHDGYDKLQVDHNKLIREWNKFVPDYNATVRPRERGRPIEASDHQVKAVKKLKKAGASLRAIASETGLGLRTVRTILERGQGTGRTAKRTNDLRRREIDRLRAAEWRSRKRQVDELPKRITQTRNRGVELVKAAKGLGQGG